MSVVNFILEIFLGASLSSPWALGLNVLYWAGMWGMFKKSGIPSWWVFVPVAREYQVGACAGRVPEGHVAAFLKILQIIFSAIGHFVPLTENAFLFMFVITLLLQIVTVIYDIRIALGLIEVYDQKKLWIIPWLFLGALPALLWGWLKRYQPLWKVEEIKSEMQEMQELDPEENVDEGW